eukprot:2290882-Rhodomonas_salina.1
MLAGEKGVVCVVSAGADTVGSREQSPDFSTEASSPGESDADLMATVSVRVSASCQPTHSLSLPLTLSLNSLTHARTYPFLRLPSIPQPPTRDLHHNLSASRPLSPRLLP